MRLEHGVGIVGLDKEELSDALSFARKLDDPLPDDLAGVSPNEEGVFSLDQYRAIGSELGISDRSLDLSLERFSGAKATLALVCQERTKLDLPASASVSHVEWERSWRDRFGSLAGKLPQAIKDAAEHLRDRFYIELRDDDGREITDFSRYSGSDRISLAGVPFRRKGIETGSPIHIWPFSRSVIDLDSIESPSLQRFLQKARDLGLRVEYRSHFSSISLAFVLPSV